MNPVFLSEEEKGLPAPIKAEREGRLG